MQGSHLRLEAILYSGQYYVTFIFSKISGDLVAEPDATQHIHMDDEFKFCFFMIKTN